MDDTVVYAHGDGRANRVFTGPTGTVVQSATYGTFGQTSTTGSSSSLTQSDNLWNGGDNFPEVGLVILGPRAYDPDAGRFLQRDPISVTMRSSTANPYAFAFSNPVDFADPTGLTPQGSEQGGTQPDWRIPLTGAAGFAPFLLPLIWSDQAAEPLAGVGASGFQTWFVNWANSPPAACDNRFCSGVDSVVSAYGDFWVGMYGGYLRGKMEALAETPGELWSIGVEGAWNAAIGPALASAELIYDAPDAIRSAIGVAGAIAADPVGAMQQVFCGGDGCGAGNYGCAEATFVKAAGGGAAAVTAVRAARKAAKLRLAFGLNKHPNHGYRKLLERFAVRVRAKTYWDFYSDTGNMETLGRQLLKLMHDADSIHFNLDGMAKDAAGVRRLIADGALGIGEGNVTNWELFQVVTRHLSKTKFYVGGRRVSRKKLGL